MLSVASEILRFAQDDKDGEQDDEGSGQDDEGSEQDVKGGGQDDSWRYMDYNRQR
jgi:hypothetical protein